jgi:hypothetical protein
MYRKCTIMGVGQVAVTGCKELFKYIDSSPTLSNKKTDPGLASRGKPGGQAPA